MKRRSFFKSFAAVIAAVALAPEIAFSGRLRPIYDWKFQDFDMSILATPQCGLYDFLMGRDQADAFSKAFSERLSLYQREKGIPK